jgi:hypothetical protein
VWPLGYNYRYRQLRDVPISQLSEDQFNYVVKSLLYAAMGYYDKRVRSRRRGNS